MKDTNPSTRELEEIPTIDNALLSARGVETGYGDLQVLFGVDIDVRDDEIVVVFGPNGAGKSTFVKALYRLLPLWNGEIQMMDRDISTLPPKQLLQHGISYVPQTDNVFPNLTVEENLDIGGLYTESPNKRKQEIFELFPRLQERLDQDASTLSGGERQMLAMARALIPNPELLLIDEPSAGLAPQLIEQTFDHVTQVRNAGTAVLMVEQNVKMALRIADRGYVLDGGETRFEGSADELLHSSQIRQLYLGGVQKTG